MVVCSVSGKPIFHYERPCAGAGLSAHGAAARTSHNTDRLQHPGDPSNNSDVSTAKSSFVSSLQGLLSFVSCVQHEELQEVETDRCRCFFQTRENLTFAIILRTAAASKGDDASSGREAETVPDISTDALQRLIQVLHSQILFVLTDRGLDVLRRQPGYDLRELLNGTERVMTSLCDRWATDPTLRFKDLGVSFVRLAPDHRIAATRALAYEPPTSASSSSAASGGGDGAASVSAMICGILLANKKVVAVSQPNKKQFSILVDGEQVNV